MKAVWINWSSRLPPTTLAIGFWDFFFFFQRKIGGVWGTRLSNPTALKKEADLREFQASQGYRARRRKIDSIKPRGSVLKAPGKHTLLNANGNTRTLH